MSDRSITSTVIYTGRGRFQNMRLTFSLHPKQAARAAHAQYTHNDAQTWDYDQRYPLDKARNVNGGWLYGLWFAREDKPYEEQA